MQRVSPSLPPSVPADAYKEWPGTPSMATGTEKGPDETMDSQGAGAIPALPLDVQTMGGVTYITGGIGDEEITQLKASKKDYNLHILVNAQGGAFISDVDVNIADGTGTTILTARGAGPYFYAKLVPGSYTVTVNDATQSKKFALKVNDGSHFDRVVRFDESGGVITSHTGTATVD
jgi:hypothetical protein